MEHTSSSVRWGGGNVEHIFYLCSGEENWGRILAKLEGIGGFLYENLDTF